MEDELAVALTRIAESRVQPEGPLKITTTVTFGSAWLTARMNRFHHQFPDIAVSLICGIGLLGGQCLSMAAYVAVTGLADGATAVGGR